MGMLARLTNIGVKKLTPDTVVRLDRMIKEEENRLIDAELAYVNALSTVSGTRERLDKLRELRTEFQPSAPAAVPAIVMVGETGPELEQTNGKD